MSNIVCQSLPNLAITISMAKLLWFQICLHKANQFLNGSTYQEEGVNLLRAWTFPTMWLSGEKSWIICQTWTSTARKLAGNGHQMFEVVQLGWQQDRKFQSWLEAGSNPYSKQEMGREGAKLLSLCGDAGGFCPYLLPLIPCFVLFRLNTFTF